MGFLKKLWQDRVSEQPQRRLLTPTDGGEAFSVDVTRQEGLVIQEGDAFSAANMNDLENRIKTVLLINKTTVWVPAESYPFALIRIFQSSL